MDSNMNIDEPHPWKRRILKNLRRRNKTEHENIHDLILIHNRLFDQSEGLRSENNHLQFQNEKLRHEMSKLVSNDSTALSSNSSTQDSSVVSSHLIQPLEQKIYKLQEELTDLHRHKSENAQQLVNLNQCLQERDKLLEESKHRLAEEKTQLMLSKETIGENEHEISDLKSLVQLLRDEYEALNLIYNSLEIKYKQSQEEIHELIERWMVLKEKDAERMNAENEVVVRKRQEIVEEKLKEASLEQKVVMEDDIFASMSPVCVSTSIPSKPYLEFDAHEGEVNAVRFSPQGRLVATGGSDRKIKLWDISHGTVDARGMLSGCNAAINAIDFDGADTLILGASNDFASRVWTVTDLRLRHTLTGHSGKVLAAKFLGEPSKVVTGSHDRTLKVWDLRSRACVRTLFAGSSCNDIAISDSNLTTIISAHFDKRLRFWDTRSEQPKSEIMLGGRITSLSQSQDGFYLLASVRDDTLRIIDLRQNSVIQTLSHEGFHLGADFTRAAFSPDGLYAACGSSEGVVVIWNASSGKVEKELREHGSCVLACSWHPEGKSLVSCDRTRKVVAWANF